MTTAEEADALIPKGPATSHDASPSASDSPGRQLRQAREAQKLEVSQLATSLRISPQVIEALECDDYERLPSAVFVSGYIRSYARLVGLDPEPLNRSFRRLHPDAEPPPRHFARAAGVDDEHADGSFAAYLIGVLVILALAAGGYGWWLTTADGDRESTQSATAPALDEEPPERSPAPAAETQTAQAPDSSRDSASAVLDTPPTSSTRAAQTPSADVVVLEQDEQPFASVSPEADETQTEKTPEQGAGAGDDASLMTSIGASAGDATAGAPASPPLPTPASPTDERPATTQTASLPADNAVAGPQTDADTETEAESETEAGIPAPDAATRPVELAFSGPCWVDIRDSTGKVLLFGEMSRGDRELLSGEPPYSLVLGNAAAAEVTLAGEPYDLSSIARGNVARFELDPAEVGGQTSAESAGSSPDAAAELND